MSSAFPASLLLSSGLCTFYFAFGTSPGMSIPDFVFSVPRTPVLIFTAVNTKYCQLESFLLLAWHSSKVWGLALATHCSQGLSWCLACKRTCVITSGEGLHISQYLQLGYGFLYTSIFYVLIKQTVVVQTVDIAQGWT